MKKCCVISTTPENWRSFETTYECDVLFDTVKELLRDMAREKDIACLMTAMYPGPETLVAEAVLRLRGETDISLECVIPFEEQAKDLPESERDRYFGILENCDKETLISTVFGEGVVEKCYRYMIESCDVILVGGTVDEAVERLIKDCGKEVIAL